MRRDPLWVGIYAHGAGWRAVVSQGPGRPLKTKHFPRETAPRAMQSWRADVRAEVRIERKRRATFGTLRYDAARYLKDVAALPTIADRTRDIGYWVALFDDRQTASLTPSEIRRQRDRWLQEPRSSTDARPLAPGTVNKRLRALSNLYTVLGTRPQDNPVRDVPEAPEPEPEPREMSYATIAKILDAMPDIGQSEKRVRGQKRSRAPFSATKVRLRCLAYCQITPKQLGQLGRADIDLARRRVRLPPRAKGRGAAAVWVPLLPDGVAAFRDFDRYDLYGPFSQHSVRHSWVRTLKRLKLPHATPYQLRHTMGSLIYRATKSRQAVQQLMQHARWETSARYTKGAEQDVIDHYGRQVAAFALVNVTGKTQPRKMSEKAGKARASKTSRSA